MSDFTQDFKTISDLVQPVEVKITAKKDPAKPYIGLEYLPSRGAHLLGWSPASSSISTNSVFSRGDILFGKLRPNLRKCVIAPFDGYCSTDILVLRAKDGIDSGFAGKIFQTEQVGAAAERTAIGTKMPRTSWRHLKTVDVFCPDIKEQKCAAQILDTLDTTIRETEALIDKLKAVKHGLLHDLLTRGIHPNGQLRQPQSAAPELYKKSPLGWIPREWEVDLLGNVAESLIDGPFGSNLKTAHYVENPGVRVVRLQNIQQEGYDDSDRAFISDRHAISLSRNQVVGGDVLIASLGDENYPVGRACCYPADLPDAVNKADCFRFRAGANCQNEFITFFMNSAPARRQVRGYEQGVTMKRINLGNLRRIFVTLPELDEQELIVERMRVLQGHIEIAKLQYGKLQQQKSGLMDDLLTGRVRVTPLLQSMQKAAAFTEA
ncbi:restriction endonuclease subunit S [Pseudomonas monteilii]|uniref:Restriction endonuclease subunit S n=1 Tax=Pseudomonas kurunegalensis TaxID=485880 RepID=A0ACC5USQ2_9PSED|nr:MULTISPECIES: restriction endonuclease subunit S [Pseudomonas]AVH36817.1 restriction endonuclease subunit S [Pseudomonas monteilii]MBV4517468.1 restriction endonuclease subunit S [Pseudomonas kurunegalensis]